MNCGSSGLDSGSLLAAFRYLVSVVVAMVAEDGQLIDCNAGFRRLLNMRGDAQSKYVAPFFVGPCFEDLIATLAEPGQAVHSGLLNVGDQAFFCHSLIGTVHREGDKLIIVAEHDVTELERLNAQVIQFNEQLAETQRELARNERRLRASEARLLALSMTDSLTGLANRRRLDEFLPEAFQRAQRYGEPFSIIMADVDHFKRVNDSHGHATGDEVLQLFGSLLRSSVREIDLVARIGGEEFVLVLAATALDAAMICAERLRAGTPTLRLPVLHAALTASFGVVQYKAGDTIASLLMHADEALYVAKNAGRNRVEAYAADWPRLPTRQCMVALPIQSK